LRQFGPDPVSDRAVVVVLERTCQADRAGAGEPPHQPGAADFFIEVNDNTWSKGTGRWC
jgi:hypothetical protein